jgi:PTH1 family peptidyl-tRNA hydrolase
MSRGEILIFGIGNPGKKFENTWHNLGLKIVDIFAKKNGFPKFKFEKELEAEISEKTIFQKKVILAKPKVYVNLSGKVAKKLVSKFGIENENFWVVQDEIDLPVGKMKISKGKSSAGHKGIESIIENLKTKDFVRFRIGIQPLCGKPENVGEFVLTKIGKKEKKCLQEVIEKAVEAIYLCIEKGIEAGMEKFNK